jgi:hypothetical protein
MTRDHLRPWRQVRPLLQRGRLQRRERWAEETGGTYREIELQSDAQREQAMRRFAEAGSNPIVMAGFSQATPRSVCARLSRHHLRHHRRRGG